MDEIGTDVRKLILRCAASSWRLEDLAEDTPIAGAGVGLDSVRLVELLYACEDSFGIRLPLEVLQIKTLTVGELVRRVAAARVHGDSAPSSAER